MYLFKNADVCVKLLCSPTTKSVKKVLYYNVLQSLFKVLYFSEIYQENHTSDKNLINNSINLMSFWTKKTVIIYVFKALWVNEHKSTVEDFHEVWNWVISLELCIKQLIKIVTTSFWGREVECVVLEWWGRAGRGGVEATCWPGEGKRWRSGPDLGS